MGIKLILDTDPGIDDAMAFFYAFGHPEIELVGFTSIFGNVRADEAAVNALRLLEFGGVEATVAQGAMKPLAIPANTPSYHVHGTDGMGNTNLPDPVGRTIATPAAQFIVEQINANPGEITLAAVGPVTNLALALQLDPTIVNKVKQVVVMGGAARAPGNVTPVAEANIWNDPHAAEDVFAAKWPLILAPLDCTMPVVFSRDYIREMKARAPKFGGFLSEIALFYSDFYEGIYGLDGCVPHDVMALTCLTRPELFTWERGAVGVSTNSIAVGNTLYLPEGRHTVDPYWQARPTHDVLTGTDAEGFRQDYMTVLTQLG